jgi:glutathione-regulated potassium-efflux system ancillary protein KefG
VITTGGREAAYDPEGYNHYTIRQLLAPMEQTAGLCKMIYLAPFVVHGTHSITPEQVLRHQADYAELLNALHENRVDIEKARKPGRINEHLDSVILQLHSL